MEKEIQKILIIDDDEDVLFAAKMLLKKHVKEVLIEKDPRKIPFLLNQSSYDVILLDMNFSQDTTSGKEGIYWLEQIKERDPSAVVILITAYGDVETAVSALKKGATDFVLKPWQNEKLIATIHAAAQLKNSYNQVNRLQQEKQQLEESIDAPFKSIIGESKALRNVFTIIDKVAATDANILILGENGTGKELIARALHKKSRRKDKSFVSVDMGALTDSLFESELFGHKKGAFTDAKIDRAGRFEIADQGTIFLDEIGNLSAALQAKLLNVLQSRTVTRLGSNEAIPFDTRLICATNEDIHSMVAKGNFRQDLLYRINTVEIHLPALRDRIEDIPLLANHFLEIYAAKYKKDNMKIDTSALRLLQKYPWPGNIRELQHAIERAIIMSDHSSLQSDDFFFLNNKGPVKDNHDNMEDSFNLDDVEKQTIQKAIQIHGGNISKAAEELGLTRASLYRRISKYDIS
ncbi:sigma-54-dependent Fis family transcriptional regulator [Marivirga sp. S37H4]|uniref:Sigma-54-dependent Fis family transcriptional regulator n=1 Tax=Marivirga aurantiaca TaxID=2802615 RepID=A0A934X1D2_9BACT|nr:sigma-54 dependent transcriptional regulator [Marivirga aurantiaca]MBK6266662.1 sigma-54-dependent Fis family transcriptional regulator [Marivirga aurantiaca]